MVEGVIFSLAVATLDSTPNCVVTTASSVYSPSGMRPSSVLAVISTAFSLEWISLLSNSVAYSPPEAVSRRSFKKPGRLDLTVSMPVAPLSIPAEGAEIDTVDASLAAASAAEHCMTARMHSSAATTVRICFIRDRLLSVVISDFISLSIIQQNGGRCKRKG